MKEWLKKAGNAVLAAVTSPTSVKAEKSVFVLVVVRLALAFGAGGSTVVLLKQLIGSW